MRQFLNGKESIFRIMPKNPLWCRFGVSFKINFYAPPFAAFGSYLKEKIWPRRLNKPPSFLFRTKKEASFLKVTFYSLLIRKRCHPCHLSSGTRLSSTEQVLSFTSTPMGRDCSGLSSVDASIKIYFLSRKSSGLKCLMASSVRIAILYEGETHTLCSSPL